MHAASVHPEPGSNSLKNCILQTEVRKIFFRAKILASSYFCMSIYNSLTRLSFSHLQCFALISCCSIFNDRFAAHPADSLYIISPTARIVNTFLKLFQISFSVIGLPSVGDPYSISLPKPFVNTYFHFFQNIFSLRSAAPFIL